MPSLNRRRVTTSTPALSDYTPTIVNVLLSMKKEGYSQDTLRFVSKALKFLNNHCNLNDTENVKEFIANYQSADSYKRNLCYAYEHYVEFNNLVWIRPKYRMSSKLPKIPSEEHLKMIISASSNVLSLKLSISKESGLRPIEVCNLRVRDFDLDKRLVYPNTAKGGSSRILKLSSKTIDMLRVHIFKHNLSLNDKTFKGTSEYYGKIYRKTRNKLAKKLNDISIKTIRLYDFRHYFATMLYHKTKDILYVKQQMGHKKIETTLIYTQLIEFSEDEYHVGTATTIEGATKLIEVGFEYVTNIDDIKIFRKRK